MSKEKTFNNLPPLAKNVLIIASSAAALFVGYKIYQATVVAAKNKGNKEEDKSVKKELEILQKDPKTKATINKAQSDIFANQIFTALDGYATDEAAVARIFAMMKNDADVLQLSDSFGIREISSGALNPEPNFKGTLAGALANELSAKWRQSISNDLAKRKIKYKF